MRLYGLFHLMPVLLHLVVGNGQQTELSMEAAFQGEFSMQILVIYAIKDYQCDFVMILKKSVQI